MFIKSFNQLGNQGIQNKTVHQSKKEVSFGEQSTKELTNVLKYIASIKEVPEDPAEDIKTVANKNNILITPKNVEVFTKTIQGVLDDSELNIEGPKKLKAYKTYLRYLNDNNDLVQNPQKIFPKPEMFGSIIAEHLTDYLEKSEQREVEGEEVKAARARSQHVRSGNWQNKLLKGLPWGLTAVMGTYIAAQNMGLPAKIGFNPSANSDSAAEVDTKREVQLPKQVNSNADKVINSVKSGSLTLFTLSKNDAKPGDKIEFYGKKVPLYYDQQNKTWGTFLVFPKQVPIEHGIGKFPVTLIRQGAEPRRLGVLEVKGNPPAEGQEIPELEAATDSAPALPTANSLTITQEPFLSPVKGQLGYKYGDISADGKVINYNQIKTTNGNPVIAPARTKVVKVTENSIVLDGGWGLQFIIAGIKPGNDIQLGKIVERGTQIAKVSDSSQQVAFLVNVNGRATNFFGDK